MSDSPSKRLLADEEATEKLDRGVATVAKYVGMTMGPKGRNVILRLGGIGEGKIISTKDGVFVANHIKLADPEEDMGAQMSVEASRKTNDAAGDGTTCTVVLIDAMLREARRCTKIGMNPILIQEGMQLEKDRVIKFLEEYGNDVKTEKDIYNIALVSCQDKDLAQKCTKITMDVGKYGTVGVEATTGPHYIDCRVVKGMHFDVGFEARLSHMTAASVAGQLQRKGSVSKLTWENDDVGVLIFDEPVRQWNDVGHIFSACVDAKKKKLLIIGEFHDDAALGLQTQLLQEIFSACTISRSNFQGDLGREVLKDIAAYCGAQFLSPADGTMPSRHNAITNIDSILGSCTASIGAASFSLTRGIGGEEAVNTRVSLIETLMESGGLNDYEKQKCKERIARFRAGIGTITIYAPTFVQQESIRTRVDDAVSAIRSANEEGVVAGGGVALLRCHQWLTGFLDPIYVITDSNINAGRQIVQQALLEPARKISEIAGEEKGVRLAQLLKHDWKSTMGYNYWTEQEADLITDGILDPKKVVRLCVENAVSTVGELLRAGATIVDMPRQEVEEPYLSPRERAERAHSRRARQG